MAIRKKRTKKQPISGQLPTPLPAGGKAQPKMPSLDELEKKAALVDDETAMGILPVKPAPSLPTSLLPRPTTLPLPTPEEKEAFQLDPSLKDMWVHGQAQLSPTPPEGTNLRYTAVMPPPGMKYMFKPDGTRVTVPIDQRQTPPGGFQRISPTLGSAEIAPVADQSQLPQRPQSQPQPQGANPIAAKRKALSAPLQPLQQTSMRRIFRILPIRRRTKFE